MLIGTSNVGVTVSWDVSNVKNTCTVTGSNGDNWSTPADVSNHAAGSNVSSVLTAPVIFTLSCTGLDDKTYTWNASAEFVPSYQEL